ncbi:flavodoxin reductase [Ginsengibacter hankyongi]|uniref:Flavodoxin reductase n=1 Tax=Ginsengibacter hankyongi TaxID=2607284 RepID=A0A5J5II12_9BACT|nr:FAD-binding oxidoreductase [Ginsengibacter hankyongi]KAA9040526.1 flavodoxin reductase [Ginsengibacter hankyongi]
MEEYPNEEHIVKILETEYVTHNVKRFNLSKPDSYKFKPGQATDIVINLPDWKEERRPFTFTSLNEWDHLEFTIKIYNDHNGVTNQLGKLHAGDELILHDVFGAINYKGEGTFIAGGAGVTPFIAIFRQLQKDEKLRNNKLIFSNRTTKDIILKDEFEKMLGKNFINTITNEKTEKYDNRKMDERYLSEKIKDLSQYFYICGPDAMIESIKEILLHLGADKNKIVIEEF